MTASIAPAASTAHAAPIHFGPADRPRLGWLHQPPAGLASHSTGIVLCATLGYEALCSHRSLRHFADAAARRGYPTLRFDYDGTGDSAGDDLDPDRWAALRQSVHDAIDELRARTGLTRVCLLGVRFGASLATVVATERDDVVGVAAIAPVVRGRAWLRELRALHSAMGRSEAPPEYALAVDVTESAGLLLSAELRTAVSALDLGALAPRPADDILVLDRDDRPASDQWVEHLRALGARVSHAALPGFVEMMLDPHEAQVPEAMLGHFIEWLEERFPDVAREPERTRPAVPSGPARVAPGLVEDAVLLDDATRLFGIVTRPVTPPTRALLLLNSGALPHSGNGRMYVRIARRLAQRGWLVLRYDVSGIGDSGVHPGAPENDVYTTHAVEDLRHAIAHVRAHYGATHIEVAGLCSGAYHGFKGAVAGLPIARVWVINPLVFYWKPGMSLAYPPYQMVQAAAQYQRSARDPAKWLKLLRGQVDLRALSHVVRARVADRARSRVRDLRRLIGSPVAEDLGADLARVVASGAVVRFIFSVGDPGEALLRSSAGNLLPKLLRDGRVGVEHLERCDHSLSCAWMQETLLARLLAAMSDA